MSSRQDRTSRQLKIQQERERREELIRRRDAAMSRSSGSYQRQQSQQQSQQQTPKGRPPVASTSEGRESKVNKNVPKSQQQSKNVESSVEEESSASKSSSASSSEESSSEDENAPVPVPELVLQKLILAGIMKHGVRSVQQMTELFQRSCSFLKIPMKDEYTNFNDISNFIKAINESISEYKMSIRTAARCEFSGQQYFMFKIDETPVSKLQSTFKKTEVDMIQNCINEMLLSDNFSISLKECVDLARKDNSKITMQEAQDFIERMIDMFYFATNMNEPAINRYNYYVTLGFRAVEELSAVIQEKQPGIIGSCRLCFQPCLHAFKCPSSTCEVLVHKFCVTNYLTTTNKCPGELQKVGSCKASWDDFGSLVKRTRPGRDEDMNNSSSTENPNANSSLESIEPVAGPSRTIHRGGGTSSKNTEDRNRKSNRKSKKVAVSSTEDSDD